jgi:predicted aspartyl protease
MQTVHAAAAVVIVALGASACVQMSQPAGRADPEPGEVPFELSGPGGAALVVPVTVNGQGPYPFVLDTGATVTCVDAALAKELELPERQGVVGIGGGVRGVGQMQVLSIDSVELGDAKVTGLIGCAVDLAPMQTAGLDIQGLLGLNFLKHYRVTLDFHDQLLRLDDPGGATAEP